ncbi:MAG: hypothetical protein LBD52_02125 [Prevotellaceae bacterium]|jgi:hypothetical protein|nr:hypothetical protein [Prevotellaceae bacterium]
MERWTEFVLGVLENEEEIDLNRIDKEMPLNLGDYPGQERSDEPMSMADYYMHLYSAMDDLYKLMRKKGYNL